MPITFTRSYQGSDGKCYATLEEAQIVEIQSVLGSESPAELDEHYAQLIIERDPEHPHDHRIQQAESPQDQRRNQEARVKDQGRARTCGAEPPRRVNTECHPNSNRG